MPSSRPAAAIPRPPILKTGSSSSLEGMEQVVPSFQSFLSRTPPLDHGKPLPPTPLVPRRASSDSPPRSTTPSFRVSRRSSSVYSRTVSQWGRNDLAWRSADLVDDPLPAMPTLQPLAYSASDPLLTQPTTPLLEPRTYQPLITTPSPSASRDQTPSPPASQEPQSVLLPTPPASVRVPKKHLRTVSLDKAKAAVNAPGAVHLLPEELRARTFGRSRSLERLTVASTDMFTRSGPPVPPEPPTLVDAQGRHRSIASAKEDTATEDPFPFTSPAITSPRATVSSISTTQTLLPPMVLQQRKASQQKARQALGIGIPDEPRGRTRQRGKRVSRPSNNLQNGRRKPSSSSSEERNDAQQIAKEYHHLLTEQYRQPSASPAYHATDSDDSIRARMKMIPQPLFQTKPPAKLPGEMRIPAGHVRNDSGMVQDEQRDGSKDSKSAGSLLRRLSSVSRSRHGRRSTSGSIPISAPADSSSPPAVVKPKPAAPTSKHGPSARRKSDDNRLSAFYPYVASRKGKAKQKPDSGPPPLPWGSADMLAQKTPTPELTPKSSPLQSLRSVPSPPGSNSPLSLNRLRRSSTTSTDAAKRPLPSRLAKGVIKYADSLARPPELVAESRNFFSSSMTTAAAAAAATANPGSPHLLPSPVKSPLPAGQHLGWSDLAKNTFDQASSSFPSPYPQHTPPEMSQFTHIAAPQRPLGASQARLREADNSPAGMGTGSGMRRQGSIFAGMLDGWKESKVERRRDELKKMIRHFANEEPGGRMGMGMEEGRVI